MRFRFILVSTAALTVAGCESGLVQDATTKFHDGFSASTAAISTQQAELLAIRRSVAVRSIVGGKTGWQPGSDEARGFIAYACLSPGWPPGYQQAQVNLKRVAAPLDPANLSASKDFFARLQGIYNAETVSLSVPTSENPQPVTTNKCPAIVSRYMELSDKDLPLPQLQGGGTAAFLAAAGVLFSAAQAAAQGIFTAAGLLEQQAKAEQALAFVRNPDTQKTVSRSFAGLYDSQISFTTNPPTIDHVHTAADGFCAAPANQPICSSVATNTGDPSDKVQTNTGEPGDKAKEQVCQSATEWRFTRPKGFTQLDGVTIAQRWMKLRIAWERYRILYNSKSKSVVDQQAAAQALDLAVSDYLTIPGTTDIAGGMVTAWARLSDLAYGCISASDAIAELTAFATNAQALLQAAQSTSDAVDKAKSTLSGASASEAPVNKGASKTKG